MNSVVFRKRRQSKLVTNKPGIYVIRCLITKRAYVGQARDRIAKRWTHHRSRLNRKLHKNSQLQLDWIKFGPKAFTFTVLANFEKGQPDLAEVLLAAETWWFEQTGKFNDLYNVAEPQICAVPTKKKPRK